MALGYIWPSVALLVVVLLFTLDIMGLFSWKNHFPVDGRTIVLTGASQGMGKSLARMLAERGANVILVARDVKKLENAMQEASTAAIRPQSQRFHVISADVTSAEDNARIIREATAWNNNAPPDIVWACAGAANPMLFMDASLDTMRRQMDINYWSCAYIARETLKVWFAPSPAPAATSSNGRKTEPPARHLIFTASTVAFCGVAGYGPYGPSKAAIRSLSDILRSEINFYNGARRHNRDAAKTSKDASNASPSSSASPAPPPADIRIHTVFPGTMSSPGLDLENRTKHDITHILEDVDPLQTCDEAAKAALRGLERGEYLVVTNWLGVAMRSAAWMGSPRGSWWRETLLAWITAVVWLFVGPDMERQVFNYGKKWGLAGKPKEP